jgi:hypothetical protein
MSVKKMYVWTAVLLTVLICITVAAVGLSYLSDKSEAKLTDLQNQITELQKTSTAEDATSDEATSDWKTYTNDEFTFKYPADYFVYDTCYDSVVKKTQDWDGMIYVSVEAQVTKDENRPCSSEYRSTIFNISSGDEEITLEKMAEDQNISSSDAIKSDITIDGQKGYKYIFKTQSALDGSYGTTIDIGSGKKVYTINWKNSDAKGTSENKYSEDILDTLTFK